MPGDLRSDAKEIISQAISGVDPYSCVHRAVRREGDRLNIGMSSFDLSAYENIYIVAFGKASVTMSRALEEILGDNLSGGCAITKYNFGSSLKTVKVMEAAHPIPDENGVLAAKHIRALLEKTGTNDLIFFLISGGGSALMTLPRKGISLSDFVNLTNKLLHVGATIYELNTIRKHLSAVKGGGLAKMAYPSESISLILSDVVGDPLDVISSGPTVPDRSTFDDFQEIVERYDLKLSPAVQGLLEDGLEGVVEDTPKSGGPAFKRCHHYLVGNNYVALQGAEDKAIELGYNTLILTSSLVGEAREVAKVLASIAREEKKRYMPLALPACILTGGETTVTIGGRGKGGRCQEMALSFVIEAQDLKDTLFLPAATDGNDGPTDAAGAFADSYTMEKGRDLHIDARTMLQENNSYDFFKETGDLLITGPTGTNVMDVYVLLIK
ncbi:glycerate kinase type-2 family protein [Methanolobus halotolerans]|uniref:Glycerate kinase n=1 Tax=Methanolobus halotolerans TaxID=2052935 RepID=A0A4E0Q262_9EURY|nr:glycerate kinase [Methanolobus halotolerans]TGC11319.1 glycerate kinase [Methanolobus halotolerans]